MPLCGGYEGGAKKKGGRGTVTTNAQLFFFLEKRNISLYILYTSMSPILSPDEIPVVPDKVIPEAIKARTDRLRLLRNSLSDCHQLEMASFFDEQLVVLNGKGGTRHDVF